MTIIAWTEDEDTGEVVPVQFENVVEASVKRDAPTQMQAKGDTILIRELK